MVTNLRLRGDHLLLFAIIFGMVQWTGSEYILNYEYITRWLGLSEWAIDKILDDLCEKEYIKFTRPGHIIITLQDEECYGKS